MNKQEQIRAIISEAKSTKAPFVQTYYKLKDLNLVSYTVDVEGFIVTYKWKGGEYSIDNPRGFVLSGKFNKADIKQAIEYHNDKKTSYLEFMQDIAEKGCAHYVVDFSKDDVIYYNKDESLKHTEAVPARPMPEAKKEYFASELKKLLNKPSFIYFMPIFGYYLFSKDFLTFQEKAGLLDTSTPGGKYMLSFQDKFIIGLNMFLPIIIFLSTILFNFTFFVWRKGCKKAIKLNEEALLYRDFGSL